MWKLSSASSIGLHTVRTVSRPVKQVSQMREDMGRHDRYQYPRRICVQFTKQYAGCPLPSVKCGHRLSSTTRCVGCCFAVISDGSFSSILSRGIPRAFTKRKLATQSTSLRSFPFATTLNKPDPNYISTTTAVGKNECLHEHFN